MSALQPATNAAGLVAALDTLGISCVVEARAGLAVLGVEADGAVRLASAALRGEVLALGRQHGFTHIAIELAVEPAIHAADATDAGAPVLRD